MVNFEARTGLITTIPSPVALKEMPPLLRCATRVKCASFTFAWLGLFRMSWAEGGPDALLPHAASSAVIASIGQRPAFTGLMVRARDRGRQSGPDRRFSTRGSLRPPSPRTLITVGVEQAAAQVISPGTPTL